MTYNPHCFFQPPIALRGLKPLQNDRHLAETSMADIMKLLKELGQEQGSERTSN